MRLGVWALEASNVALGITHGIFALAAGTAAMVFLGGDPIIVLAFALLGGLLPDIDHPGSIIGRKTKPIGWLLKHRGFIHSLIAAVFFTVLVEIFMRAAGYFRTPYPAAFLLGYLSHLLLDGVTKEGVQLFYPAKLRLHGSAKTGSAVEWIVAILLSVALLWFWI